MPQAQNYPELSIQEIQNVPDADLAACIDTSIYLNDTVIVSGTVVMDGGLAQVRDGRNVWIQSGTGPFSGIDVFADRVPVPVQGTDFLDLVAGDSVIVTGIVFTFGNESEILPLFIEVVATDRPVLANPISVGALNDDQRTNNLETGEQWEGAYVELTDVTVTAVDFFSSGSRVSITVADGDGNLVNLSDRFLAQRLPATGGTFVAPTVGTVYDTIRGVVVHSANGCTNQGGRGYEIYPFQASDYVVKQGASAPLISGISNTPGVPGSSEDVVVVANIEDVDGTVDSATLFYAIGIDTEEYTGIGMADGGGTFSATIPNTEYNDGDIIKYYVSAVDNDDLETATPDVPGGNADPRFFVIRDGGLTIFDVQFTPFSNGNSGFVDQTVTVEGVVISSAEPG